MTLQIVIYPTNEELRRLKSLYRLTIPKILGLLTSEWGGPGESTIASWLSSPDAKGYNKMPGNSLDYLIIRLNEAGYRED